jgi:hypothetical protein
MGFQEEQHDLVGPLGPVDGAGGGDHDEPYRFGRRPRGSVPYPFSTRQYARLLVFRGRLQERLDRQNTSGQAA